MNDGFGVENLPLGVARLPDGPTVCVSALGEHVIVLSALAHAGVFRDARLPGGVFAQPSLLPFLGCGRPARRFVRRRLTELIADGDRRLRAALVTADEVEMHLPVAVGDFVDFNASVHHATNMGRLLRPGSDPLPPHWRRFPPAYHGRAGSVVATGTPVVRPHGWVVAGPRASPSCGRRPPWTSRPRSASSSTRPTARARRYRRQRLPSTSPAWCW